MKKKIISFFISITLVLSFCFGNICTDAVVYLLSPNSAHAGDYTQYPALADKLTRVFAGDIDLYDEDGKEVSLPIGSRMNNKTMYSIKNDAGKDILYGWQCYIYANAVYKVLFGEPGGHGKTNEYKYSEVVIVGGNTVSYDLFKKKNVLCGAYLRTTIASDGTYSGNNGHSLIVLSYDANKISYIEGNGDSQGLVRIVTTTWDDFNKRHLSGRNRYVSHVVQPKISYYNELYGTSFITLSFNANGGDGISLEPIKAYYNGTYTLPANQFEKEGLVFKGWNVRRESDGKIATDSGWYSESEIASKSLQKKVFKNCETIVFDKFWYDSDGHIEKNEKFVFLATWGIEEVEPPVIESKKMVLNVDSASVPSGKTVTTTITVTENPGVALLDLTINTPNYIKLVKVVDGEVLGNMITLGNNSYSWQLSGDSTRTGILATLTFEVSNEAHVGSYTITPTVERCCGFKGDKEVTAEEGIIKVVYGQVECVSLDVEEKTIQLNQTLKVNAVVSPSNADNGQITWTTSNSKVATVSNGKVTAKGVGTVVITATAGDFSAKATFTVVKVRGDFNDDGMVTTEDAQYLLKHIVFGDTFPINQGADLDGDGQVTSDDVVYLMNYKNNHAAYPLN